MALPSVAKLAHAISQHPERQCSKEIRLHIHKAEFDCVFQKFKVSVSLYPGLQPVEFWEPQPEKSRVFSFYDFPGSSEEIYFSLRAPPGIS